MPRAEPLPGGDLGGAPALLCERLARATTAMGRAAFRSRRRRFASAVPERAAAAGVRPVPPQALGAAARTVRLPLEVGTAGGGALADAEAAAAAPERRAEV